MWRNEASSGSQCMEPTHFVLGSFHFDECDRHPRLQYAENEDATE